MKDKHTLQIERIEKLKEKGSSNFILKYGLSFALLFGTFVFFFAKPPVSIFILLILIIIGGLLFGTSMWFFIMNKTTIIIKIS